VKKVDKLSIREAVKHFDVSRPTLQKALKSGKISGVQNEQGTWTIDPSEMARVYQPRPDKPTILGSQEQGELPIKNTPLPGQVETLKEQLADAEKRAAIAEALAEERGKHIEDLRRMLPAPEGSQSRRRWWPW
jgi:predicted site-specific integrase-resolvase